MGDTPAPVTSAAPDGTGIVLTADALTALTALLAVEHAAVYATAAAGGALAPVGTSADAGRRLAAAAYTAHRELRDELTALILGAGAQPPAALPAYTLPVSPDTVPGALTLLAELDDRTAAAAFAGVGAVAGPTRALLVDALTQAAIRAQRARLTDRLPVTAAMQPLPGQS